MVAEVPLSEARAQIAELVNRVVYGGERIMLTRHGKAVAAIVSPTDLESLQHRDAPVDETSRHPRWDQLNERSEERQMPGIAARNDPPAGPQL